MKWLYLFYYILVVFIFLKTWWPFKYTRVRHAYFLKICTVDNPMDCPWSDNRVFSIYIFIFNMSHTKSLVQSCTTLSGSYRIGKTRAACTSLLISSSGYVSLVACLVKLEFSNKNGIQSSNKWWWCIFSASFHIF